MKEDSDCNKKYFWEYLNPLSSFKNKYKITLIENNTRYTFRLSDIVNYWIESLKNSQKSGKSSSIVVVAEGDKTGKNVFEIASYVENNMPEYEVRVSVLGHMQRGGAPSCFDRVLASRMGVSAVESILNKKSNLMVGIENDEIILSPLENAVKGQTEVNKNLIRVSEILSI